MSPLMKSDGVKRQILDGLPILKNNSLCSYRIWLLKFTVIFTRIVPKMKIRQRLWYTGCILIIKSFKIWYVQYAWPNFFSHPGLLPQVWCKQSWRILDTVWCWSYCCSRKITNSVVDPFCAPELCMTLQLHPCEPHDYVIYILTIQTIWTIDWFPPC